MVLCPSISPARRATKMAALQPMVIFSPSPPWVANNGTGLLLVILTSSVTALDTPAATSPGDWPLKPIFLRTFCWGTSSALTSARPRLAVHSMGRKIALACPWVDILTGSTMKNWSSAVSPHSGSGSMISMHQITHWLCRVTIEHLLGALVAV